LVDNADLNPPRASMKVETIWVRYSHLSTDDFSRSFGICQTVISSDYDDNGSLLQGLPYMIEP
jgi:hypothetical protein